MLPKIDLDDGRLRYIGGPGEPPVKIDLKLAVKWPNIGHIRVHMRIYGYKLPLKHVGTTYKCPRISRGDSRGLSPRNSHWLPPINLSLVSLDDGCVSHHLPLNMKELGIQVPLKIESILVRTSRSRYGIIMKVNSHPQRGGLDPLARPLADPMNGVLVDEIPSSSSNICRS